MPRKRKDARGGAREGAPGKAYANRGDLTQAPKAGPSRTYGDATRQLEAQRANPLPAAAPPASGPGAPAPPGVPGAALPPETLQAMLAGLPGLTDPSGRPGEPLTAGLPTGPGPGPSGPRRDPAGLLRAMLAEDPSPELFELVELAERGGVPPTGPF